MADPSEAVRVLRGNALRGVQDRNSLRVQKALHGLTAHELEDFQADLVILSALIAHELQEMARIAVREGAEEVNPQP